MEQITNSIQVIITNCVLTFWYWYTRFVYSLDVHDRKTPEKKAPQWRYLQKLLGILQKYRRIVILKTRQMFFSTFIILYVLWIFLFSLKPQRIFIISEILAKAYNKGDDSLYGRFMYAYNRLPDYMKTTIEPSFQPEVIMRNKITDVTITFSANKPTAGRGSSFDLVIVDEYAWHDANTAKDLISSLAPMCYMLWVFSSPRGHNHFWKLIQDIIKNEIEGFYFWDATGEKIDEEDIQRLEIYNGIIKATPAHLRAREFGGSFDETEEGKTFPDFKYEEAHLERPPMKEDLFKYQKMGAQDFGIRPDPTALVLWIIKEGEFHKFFSLELNNCLPEAFVGACVDKLMRDYKDEHMTEIEARMILAETEIFGDASSNNISNTHDTTLLKEFKKYGLNRLKPSLRLSIKDGILAINQMIETNRLREFVRPEEADIAVITQIKNCHFPVSNAGVIITMDKYEHDSIAFSSHTMDTVRYLCVNYLRQGKLQGFETVKDEIDKRNAIAEKILPVFVGHVTDFNGNIIRGGGRNDSNLT
jgi:hypothetical protein